MAKALVSTLAELLIISILSLAYVAILVLLVLIGIPFKIAICIGLFITIILLVIDKYKQSKNKENLI